MASFVPPLLDPTNPDAVANWAREVADTINGQLSIGEPRSLNPDPVVGGVDPLRLNGVKGHLLGSFVTLSVDNTIGNALDQSGGITCTHNLHIPNKGVGTGPTDMNVGWVIVRWEHDGAGSSADATVSALYETGSAITADSISLTFHAGGSVPRTVDANHPLYITIWFFPTTI